MSMFTTGVNMFFRILKKSLSKRKGRIAVAIIAVIMGASIASALVSVSLDIEDKVSREFSAFGANILLVPKSDSVTINIGNINYGSITEQNYIREDNLYKIKTIENWSANILGFTPYLYSIVTVNNNGVEQNVVLTGTWFQQEVPEVKTRGENWNTGVKKISPWWELEGLWIDEEDTESAIIGKSVSEKLGLNTGDTFQVTYFNELNETYYKLIVTGIVETGSSEDEQIFVNLDVAQNITNRENMVQTVQVSALCNKCPIEVIAIEIERALPYVEAKSVKAVTTGQMQLLEKIEEMMILITIVALFASALGVMTTMTTSVVERTKEIGLMKAIGAENRNIAALFYSESLIIGVSGGFLGFFVGIVLAQFIGINTFDSTINPRFIVLPLTVGISVFISILASAFPVKRALKIEPAKVLRGE